MRSVIFNPREVGLRVGLEIHQQLSTAIKLFCQCNPARAEGSERLFVRQLRPSQSELGEVDPAALFEFKKNRTMTYRATEGQSCLVEADEEPPHELNGDAVESALLIAAALESNPVDEIEVMRKIVIDGSNTSGFQRTMVVALGGRLKVDQGHVGVQTICLEEDAARILGERQGGREYALDRLGVPLVEIALEPVTGTPEEVQNVALCLGRLLRSSGRVARGLGTIRQDVNVSILGGSVVEVKGVQKLDLVGKIVEYETLRQLALVKVAKALADRGIVPEKSQPTCMDVTELLRDGEDSPVRRTLKEGGRIFAVKLPGFSGLLGLEPYPGIRLGKELVELVQFYGVNGILHSDELPGHGLSQEDVARLKTILSCSDQDACVVLSGPKESMSDCLMAVAERAKLALKGPPAETRGPTADGKTRFIRPRPGAARMYPETDVPSFPIRDGLYDRLKVQVPPSWEDQVDRLTKEWEISRQQAIQILDAGHEPLFEELCSKSNVSAGFIAATLSETMVSLSREGLDPSLITEDDLRALFMAVGCGDLAKEAVPTVLRSVMRRDTLSVSEAVKKLSQYALTPDELRSLVDRVLDESADLIGTLGERAFGSVMGRVMQHARGRVDGSVVSKLVREGLGKRIGAQPQGR